MCSAEAHIVDVRDAATGNVVPFDVAKGGLRDGPWRSRMNGMM